MPLSAFTRKFSNWQHHVPNLSLINWRWSIFLVKALCACMRLSWCICLYRFSGLKTSEGAGLSFTLRFFLVWLCDCWRSVGPVIITFKFTGVKSVWQFHLFLFSSSSMNYPWKWIRNKLEPYLANKTVCCGVRGGAAIRAFKSAFSSSSSATRLELKSSM